MPTAPTQRRSLPLWVILVAGIAFVVVWAVLFRLLPTPSLEPTKNAAVGKPLSLLELQPLTGASDAISLNDIQGKVALINYWGTWCPPCVMEFPHMVELWNRHRDDPGFAFLSISSTFDDHEDLPAVREATENFLNSRSVTHPTYIDAQGASRRALAHLDGTHSLAYPTTVLVDRSGIIRAVWVGYIPGSEREMETVVSKLLAETSSESSH